MTSRVHAPLTPDAFRRMYRLRWEVLRKPWDQPEGSERDPLDATAIHALVTGDGGEALAVGRIHFNTPEEAQIRYMAVHPGHRGSGLGRLVLEYLEDHARRGGAAVIVLEARENAVPFYERNGYAVTEKTFLLFGDIQHYRMRKELQPNK